MANNSADAPYFGKNASKNAKNILMLDIFFSNLRLW